MGDKIGNVIRTQCLGTNNLLHIKILMLIHIDETAKKSIISY
jgi:hypothetical protein